MNKSKFFALAFGGAFLGAGLLGFVPNPIVSHDGLFAVNTVHNFVHLITAAGFFLGALALNRPRLTLQSIGLLYVGVSILGFLTPGETLLGIIHINDADKWLHVGLAAAILVPAFGIRDPEPTQDELTTTA